MECITIICFVLSFIVISESAPAVPIDLAPSGNSDRYAEDMKHRYYIGLECLEDTRTNIQSVTKSIQSPLNPAQDDKYKDFLACSFKKQGFQTTNGKMQLDHIKDFLSRYYTMNDLKVIDDCKSVNAETHGEVAYESMKCIMRKLVNLVEKGNENNEI